VVVRSPDEVGMGHAPKGKTRKLDDNADPFLLYSVPQTASGAKKSKLQGDWQGIHPEPRADSIYWIYWVLLLFVLGVMGTLLLKYIQVI
jgi:hypothetical protein